MILLMLLLATSESGGAHKFHGEEVNGSCVCEVNTTVWAFPITKYEVVTQLLQSCEDSLHGLQTQMLMSVMAIPKMEATLENVTARLQSFQYLNTNGFYNALHLNQLSQDLQELHHTINTVHLEEPGAETQRLQAEVQKVQEDVEKMYKDNIFNLETVREKLRSLHNRAQTCRTIPSDFRSSCSHRVMRNISKAIITKRNPFSTSYISGAWGHDLSPEREVEERYWIQPLASGHRTGITLRFYSSYEDFMADRSYRDESVANSYSDSGTIQGSGTIVHNNIVYYQCYDTDDLCSFNISTNKIRRLKLPGAGINNKFPYCYYTCRDWTDISLSVDHGGLWVMYATEADHGNIVISRVDTESFNITHTWKTRLFKRSVTSAFMVCGVVYATRYINPYREEVFYAFDTSTGTEDNTLSLPLEKVASGVANLHYNEYDMKLYMYNDGYLLAYQAYF